MKTVYLLRHAKSKQDPAYESDFERPLNKRGKRNATELGQWLHGQNIAPDLIISSPAIRARQTVEQFTRAAGLTCAVRYEPLLYAHGEGAYLDTLAALDDTIGSVMLVGHNPDISLVVERLSEAYDRMVTCALARIDLPIEHWKEATEQRGELRWVWQPTHDLD